MAVVKNLMVRAGADFSAISKQAKRANASMRGMEASVKKSCAGMSVAAAKMSKAFSLLGVGLSVAGIAAFSKSAKEAFDLQAQGEAKLAQVMRNTIGASEAEIQSIKDLTAAQQALGVIGDEVQLAGAQELATYVSMTSTLKTLIPVLNDMTAQQYGLGATMENSTNIATMLGKVMSGQTSGLSRYGYYFTKAQEAVLKFGTEAQKAATLAEVVAESVGGMNAALAATPSGRLKQVSNTLGDIKENFGRAVTTIATVFLPGLNAVCSILANVATLANKVAQAISNVFGGGAAKSTAAVVSYTAGAASAMDDLTESTKKAGAAAKKSLGTFSFDTLQKLSASSGGGSGSGEDGGGGGTGSAGGLITETAGEAGEAAESVGWLEKGLARIKKTIDSLNFDKLAAAFQRLKDAAAPLGKTLFAGLEWAYTNIFEPLAHWTVEDALPAFLDMLGKSAAALAPALGKLGEALKPLAKAAFDGLRWGYENIFIPLGTWVGSQLLPAFLDVLAGACDVLSAAVAALKPLGVWLWEKFLRPLAAWTGGVIVDVLHKVADALRAVAGWISKHETLVRNAVVVLGSFVAAWKLVQGAISIAKTAFSVASTAVKLFGAAVAFLTSPIGIAVAAIGTIIAVVALLALNWDKVKEAAAAAWEAVQNAWSAAGEWFSSTVVEPLKAAWNTAMEAVKTWASNAWAAVQSAWSAAGEWFSSTVAEPLKAAWNTAMEAVKTWASNAWAAVQSAWSAAGSWFRSTVAEPVKTAWTTGMEAVKTAASNAWNAVKSAWNSAGSWFKSTVAEPVKTAWNAGMESVKALASGAWEKVKSVWSGAAGWFKSSVTDPIANGFKSFTNTAIGFFQGLANGAIKGVNGIISALNRIHINVPDWVPGFGGHSWGFNLPTVPSISLPRLANGAVFEGNDPYLAIVNDQKHGVNVESPLSTIVEAMLIALRQSDFGGGDINVSVRAVFEGQLAALARYLRPYFEAEASRVGPRASKGGV